jgi:hypothetical protein
VPPVTVLLVDAHDRDRSRMASRAVPRRDILDIAARAGHAR